jgi:hypothetical protein
MKLSITDLRTDRQWRSATGLDKKRFRILLSFFESSYQKMFGQTLRERQSECPDQPHLNSYEDLLLFTLFSLKSGLTYDLLGLVTGMDGSTAKRNQESGLAVLKHTLVATGHAPRREFKSPEEFQDYFQKHKTVIIDATEQRTKRPGDRQYQKQMYSGKKNHTP